MKLDKITEKKIKEEALGLLKDGKPEWDIPHTLNVVKWMKILIKEEGGNERILIPTAYFHDTGYEKLKKGYDFDDMMRAKKSHAENGAKNVEKIFPKLDFNKEEIKRIAYLVENHDKHNNITEDDRQLIFEADGLAMIDWEVVPPNFDKENIIKFLEKYYDKRKKYIKTVSGKKYLKKLMTKAEKYLENLK